MKSTDALNAMLAEVSLMEEMDVDLGDARRTARVQRVTKALEASSAEPFPKVFT